MNCRLPSIILLEQLDKNNQSLSTPYLINFNEIPIKKNNGVVFRILPFLDFQSLFADNNSSNKKNGTAQQTQITLFELSF